MIYGSVCSGIEAATVAWHHLGWQPAWFSEIEKFPCAVLKHHYPGVPNMGDMTKFKEWYIDGTIDLLVGGTPCQSFSVAGLRKGLDDPRGNLMLTYIGIAKRYRPKWVVWENVPGVLSSNGGKDFASLLRGLEECGYGVAFRVLDAQYFGVPQRRRRVFVVGYIGDWRPAAAVLFEFHSLQGHSAPSREKGERVAPSVTSGPPFSRTENERVESQALISYCPDVTTIDYQNKCDRGDSQHLDRIICMESGQGQAGIGIGTTLNCNHEAPIVAIAINKRPMEFSTQEETAFPLRATDYKDGQCVAFQQNADGEVRQGEVACTINQNSSPSSRNTPMIACAIRTANTQANGHRIAEDVAHTLDQTQGQAIAFAQNTRDEVRELGNNVAGALAGQPGMKQQTYLRNDMQARRLTPKECERLQGFPDEYTLIPWRGKNKELCPDGPRYKALGNSMAVPVMRWIGKRIEQVDEILRGNL